MPYEIVKKPSGKFQVINKNTGEIHAKGTTLKKAKAQVRLLGMVDRKTGGDIIQPINKKPDYNYCCGGNLVQPVNPKFLPFF
jgi:hypothetical protein